MALLPLLIFLQEMLEIFFPHKMGHLLLGKLLVDAAEQSGLAGVDAEGADDLLGKFPESKPDGCDDVLLLDQRPVQDVLVGDEVEVLAPPRCRR